MPANLHAPGRVLAAILVLFMLGACGASAGDVVEADDASSESSSAAESSSSSAPADEGGADPDGTDTDGSDAVSDETLDAIDDLTDSLEERQAAVGGGEATLTVGDQSWTFSPVLCAFGEEQIGQEGAEFVLSAIQDGVQMYASIDRFGHSASINDVRDFENPSVSISSAFGGDDFLTIDGKNFSGTAEFMDDTSDSFETVTGTISGTCP